MRSVRILSHNEGETIKIGSKLGRSFRKGDVVALEGELGSGKTIFVKGIAKGIGVENYRYVNSPTFVIIKEYEGKTKLFHFDVYRLSFSEFSETVDYRSYFYDDGVSVIEWADKIKELLPKEHLRVRLKYSGPTGRELVFSAYGGRYERLIEVLE